MLGLFCVGLFGSDDATWQRRAVIALAVAASVLHLVTPLGTPQPQIDVFAWTPAGKAGRPEGGELQAARALYALLVARYG